MLREGYVEGTEIAMGRKRTSGTVEARFEVKPMVWGSSNEVRSILTRLCQELPSLRSHSLFQTGWTNQDDSLAFFHETCLLKGLDAIVPKILDGFSSPETGAVGRIGAS